MGGVRKLEIPDYKTYQVGPWTPELQDVERRLAARGLKDPWLRNEVWRFDRRIWKSPRQRFINIVSRGFFPGLGLAVISTFIYNYLESQKPHRSPWFASRTGDDGHGGHH